MSNQRAMPLYQDPFYPVLYTSEALNVSQEQLTAMRNVLHLVCSDSRFEQKAIDAFWYILTNGASPVPLIATLTPQSATLGSPNFTLHVHGNNFDIGAQIIWNGSVEPTTRVSVNEVTTEVDMSTAQVAMPIPIVVQNSDGVMSNQMIFHLDAASGGVLSVGPTKPHLHEIGKEPTKIDHPKSER